MPTDSNESFSSSLAITSLSIPSMSASTAISNGGPNHSRTPTPTRSHSPSQSIDKLKCFLSTLYEFGSDISNEVGERVRALILALVVSSALFFDTESEIWLRRETRWLARQAALRISEEESFGARRNMKKNDALSAEEFHGKIQAVTNFPLRPFALPFLKSTLPLLQKDLAQLAHQSRQSPSQFLAQNEDLILLPRDKGRSPMTSTSKEQINENGKRKLADEMHELEERPYAIKRSSAPNLSHRPFVSSSIGHNLIPSTSMRRDGREKERAFSSYLREYGFDSKEIGSKNTEDDWKGAENMLNCILEMVTKAKRAMFALQQNDSHLRRLIETCNLDWRRRHADLLAQTEVRVSEVRRKAEEVVLEIKRQSIIDLQKAVSQSEQKSNEILLREREQYQRLHQELKSQTFEEVYAVLNRQEDGPEHCRHCGRKAVETCSGCNIARYCGQYCQHRDWELHQKLCGMDLKRKLGENPHLYRRLSPKVNPNVSSHDPKEMPSANTATENSDITAMCCSLEVSLPDTAEPVTVPRSAVNGNDDQSDAENDESSSLKGDSV